MSSPNSYNRAQELFGDDIVTKFLTMQRELISLRRDFQQSGKSLSWQIATPSVPASTITTSNTYQVPVTIYIRGGTVTNINIQGQLLGMTSGTFRLNPGDTIAVTYSVTPTWFWYGD